MLKTNKKTNNKKVKESKELKEDDELVKKLYKDFDKLLNQDNYIAMTETNFYYKDIISNKMTDSEKMSFVYSIGLIKETETNSDIYAEPFWTNSYKEIQEALVSIFWEKDYQMVPFTYLCTTFYPYSNEGKFRRESPRCGGASGNVFIKIFDKAIKNGDNVELYFKIADFFEEEKQVFVT